MNDRHLTSFQRVMNARHFSRPYLLDYIQVIMEDFIEMYGDRHFAEDPALICGFAKYHGLQVAIIGHQKGRDTRQRRLRNFGMPKPEGYRKALRFMKVAHKFNRPVLTFIDTPGAYPGIDAEEHGQAEAIARNLLEMVKLNIPVITTIIGEGGSGGALAIGVSDSVLMQENAIYSVISPEGCAAILWKDAAKSSLAAEALRLTAPDLFRARIIDRIIQEPPGGAHDDLVRASEMLDEALYEELRSVIALSDSQRLSRRYNKLRALGYA